MGVWLFWVLRYTLQNQVEVVNLTDLSLPPTATLMPWMVCTVWPGKVRGEEFCITVNMYSVCVSWWAWGGKAA